MYINFQRYWVSSSVKTVHTNLFVKIHKLQPANRILKISRLSDIHYPITKFQAEFEINRPIRYEITTKKYVHRRQTNRRTDVVTDGQTSCTATIGSFSD